MNKRLLILLMTSFLFGCAPMRKLNAPRDFIDSDKTTSAHVRLLNVRDKSVLKKSAAYKKLNRNGFITIPYDESSSPTVMCEPLHLSVVQLEQGEVINNIDLGDTAHWLISTALVGTHDLGTPQITIKPKEYDLSTDMVVTTNKRTYRMQLISRKGHVTHLLIFRYPQTLSAAIPNTPVVNIKQLDFDYSLSGDATNWKPTRIFNDGDKTFIQFPALAERFDLPVLFVARWRTLELVNYRYQRPYYIVDGLFIDGVLISGSGRSSERILIHHEVT